MIKSWGMAARAGARGHPSWAACIAPSANPDQAGPSHVPRPAPDRRRRWRSSTPTPYPHAGVSARPEVLRRTKQSGVVTRSPGRRRSARALFNDSRMNRLVEQEAMASAAAPPTA